MNFIEFRLTHEQKVLVEPIVRAAGASRQNVLFIATAAPCFHDDESFWRFQVVNLSPATATKLRRLVATAVSQGRKG